MNIKQVSGKSFLIVVCTTLLLFNSKLSKIFAQIQVIDEIFENIYIHTDKSIYTPGEDIWFKAYILDEETHIPVSKSNILYLNIIDSKGECIFSTKLPIINGFANGEYHIPDTLKKDILKIVAYTENLENLSPSFWYCSELVIDPTPIDLWKIIYKPELSKLSESVLAGEVYCVYSADFPIKDMKVHCRIESSGKKMYSKTEKTDSLGKFEFKWNIPLSLKNKDVTLCLKANYLNDTKEIKINVPCGKREFHINFYPEGGFLVQGLLNKVAFKAVDNYGSPLNIKGVLVNQNGDQLQEIKTNHEGMGVFAFIPKTKDSYYFKINDPVDGDSLYNLPKPLESGYVLSVEQTDNSIIALRISMTPDMKGKKVKLSLFDGFKQKNIFESVLNEEKLFSFLTSTYPVGIATLTLLSENNVPVAERLVFLNKYKKLQLSIETDKDSYDPREKVDMMIKAFDFEGNPASANLSLSVTEENRMLNNQTNMSSYLLLDSKLKGKVRNSSYYLQDTQEADSALNILLMTHGWRKIELIEEYSKLILSPENTPGIKGHVYTRKKKPAKNATVQIINTRTWQIISTETNDQGAFLIPIEDYLLVADNQDLSISATIPNKKEAQLTIIIDSKIISGFKLKEEKISVYNMAEKMNFLTEEFVKNKYTNFDNSTEFIDEVVVTGKKLGPLDDEEDVRERMYKINKKESEEIKTFNFQSSNESFDGGMLQLLRTIAPGFQLSPLGIIKYRGYNSIVPEFEQGVLFVVDGIPKGDKVDAISWISISDIKEIKVITNPGAALIYSTGASGIVEITLKDGRNSAPIVRETPKNNNLSVIKGFKVVREFYSPDYSAHTQNQANDIDFRSTLYWNPNLILDNQGQGKITFYNGDKKARFRCHINGVSESGLLGNTQINYRVK